MRNAIYRRSGEADNINIRISISKDLVVLVVRWSARNLLIHGVIRTHLAYSGRSFPSSRLHLLICLGEGGRWWWWTWGQAALKGPIDQ